MQDTTVTATTADTTSTTTATTTATTTTTTTTTTTNHSSPSLKNGGNHEKNDPQSKMDWDKRFCNNNDVGVDIGVDIGVGVDDANYDNRSGNDHRHDNDDDDKAGDTDNQSNNNHKTATMMAMPTTTNNNDDNIGLNDEFETVSLSANLRDMMTMPMNLTAIQEEVPPPQNLNDINIVSISSIHDDNDNNNSNEDANNSHIIDDNVNDNTCSICLDEFKNDDDICTSKNNIHCPHVFHLECMMEWLMRHDECPLCRHDFLKLDGDGNDGNDGDDSSNSRNHTYVGTGNTGISPSSRSVSGAMIPRFQQQRQVGETMMGIRVGTGSTGRGMTNTPRSPSLSVAMIPRFQQQRQGQVGEIMLYSERLPMRRNT
jgi:hypothetical protein